MKENQCWHGLDAIYIKNFKIEVPLTYVQASNKNWIDEPSIISCDLPVDSNSKPLEQLGYWPSYSGMTSAHRSCYLQWMSKGREIFPVELGYAFVFFYGLERRALVSGADISLIAYEVLRLRKLHASTTKPSASFNHYTGAFLWYLVGSYPEVWTDIQIQALAFSDRKNGEMILPAVNWAITRYDFLPDWLAFAIALSFSTIHYDDYFKYIKREAFRLFQKRYLSQWPQGINLHPVSKNTSLKREIKYYAASSSLSEFVQPIQIPKKVLTELDTLSQIGHNCLSDIAPYGRLIQRCHEQNEQPKPFFVWDILPTPLRPKEHPLKTEVSQIIGNITPENKYFSLKISRIADLIELPTRDKYTLTQSKRIAQLVDDCGYSIEPDSRFTGKSYNADEIVVAFSHCEQPEDLNRYKAASLLLRLGLIVASADDAPQADQLKLLARQILEIFHLTPLEQRRMAALANLLIATGASLTSARISLEHLTNKQRGVIGKFLLAIVSNDGVITQQEMKSLQSSFKRLKLDLKELDRYIDELRAKSNVTIIQRGGKRPTGEKIAEQPKEAIVVQLNHDRIKALLQDTHEVQQALAEAMGDEADEDAPQLIESMAQPYGIATKITAKPTAEVERDNDITEIVSNESLANFYRRLIERDVWPVAEASSLAKKYGYMLNGAVEEINDWATERMGGQLLYEEGNCLIIEKELLN